MEKKINPLPQGKDTELKAKCDSLGLTIASSRQVQKTIPARKEGGKVIVPPSTTTENLATVELQDGSTITVDVDNPEHAAIVERAAGRVEQDIQAGKRLRKPKA